eukprot:gene35528-45497_t
MKILSQYLAQIRRLFKQSNKDEIFQRKRAAEVTIEDAKTILRSSSSTYEKGLYKGRVPLHRK